MYSIFNKIYSEEMWEMVQEWSLEINLFEMFKATIVGTGKSIDFY